MAIKMIAPFKQYKTGQVVDPPADLAEWLISRNYADPVADEEKPAAKKGKK